MFESIHVSVPKIMSGFVLSIRFRTWPCFSLMDCKFTFNIPSGAFSFVRLFFFLSGVDACIGLMLFDGVGLAREVSDRTL
jgi:hypothetical protein